MKSPDIAPEVFDSSSEIILKRDEETQLVHVPTSPDGGYIGNGAFKNAEDQTFTEVTGFDKTGPTVIWFHKGKIVVPKHPLLKIRH